MNCQFKVVSVKLQSAVVFQWVKEVKNYANRLFSSREVFDKKVCTYFFSKWKNKRFISQFYKKILPFRRRKKPTGRALNLAKHIIIISPGWYTSMVYISMCVDPMIRSIFHTNGSFLVLLVLLITDLDLDPRRWWWRVNFLKHDQIINSSCHTRLEFP